jgi:hypothetical protein
MFDFNPLFEFSRTHCVTICTFLVPANLLTTLQTLILVGLHRPQIQVQRSTGVAGICALVMILHVLTWFMVGVVMLPTYILLFLGGACLGINLWAVFHSSSMRRLLLATYSTGSFALGKVRTLLSIQAS